MNRKDPTEYELPVKALLTTRLQEFLPDSTVEHNCRVEGKSGHRHQIDILARLKIAGVSLVIAAGGTVVGVFTIMNREAGADQLFAELGWPFFSLFGMADFKV